MVPSQAESDPTVLEAGPGWEDSSRNQGNHRGREGSPDRSSKASGPGSQIRVSALPTYPLPSIELSSSSSKSTAGLVRGGHDRVDTFRARTEPLE